MKRVLFLSLIMVLIPVLKTKSQNPDREKLNAYKIAFFTKRLNLTSQEAERFWPVYNEYQERRNEIQKERLLLFRSVNQNSENLTEKEISDDGDKLVSLQLKEANLALEFHKKFKEILKPIKVLRLYQAENQYRLQLLKELQERRPIRNN
jgi:hypothetical protein